MSQNIWKLPIKWNCTITRQKETRQRNEQRDCPSQTLLCLLTTFVAYQLRWPTYLRLSAAPHRTRSLACSHPLTSFFKIEKDTNFLNIKKLFFYNDLWPSSWISSTRMRVSFVHRPLAVNVNFSFNYNKIHRHWGMNLIFIFFNHEWFISKLLTYSN